MFSLNSLRSLFPFIRPYRNWLIFGILMAIPLSAVRVGPVPLVKFLVDHVLVEKDESLFAWVPIAIIFLYAVNLAVRFLHYYAIRVVVVNVNKDMRVRLFEHLTHLSTDYFSEKKSGELLSRITADPANLDNGIASLNVLVREPITFLTCLGAVLYMNWKLTLLTLFILPILTVVLGKSGKYIKRRISQYQQENAELYSSVQESISGMKVLHLFNLQDTAIGKLRSQVTEITRLLLKISKIEELASPLVELVSAFALALIFYYGGRSVLDGTMTSGDLMAFFVAFALMVNPIRQLAEVNSKVHTASAAMERINEFFSWKPRVRDSESAKSLEAIQTGIRFQNVEFFYPDSPERKVLKGINFDLPVGKTIALVGQSGSGKSSLVQLLSRSYDVTAGAILIDGSPLREYRIRDWRSLLAVVSQEVFLFHDTIYHNILMGRPDATREEVHSAAKQAFAHDFIERLPGGYDTIVGDRGMKLSGGERQRISIARAFLKDARCLVLDEATSNLDNESEKIVQKSLESLMKNRTTLVIAHRLSTIQDADRIIVMREGEIIEQGQYDTLMAEKNEFYRLASIAGMKS